MASGLGFNEDTAEPAARPGAPRRGWALAVVLGYGLQVAWRLWLARDVSAPIAHFDEDDYLLVARYLSGGPAANLSYRSPLRPMGYPLLLAPLYWFTHDTGVVFRGAQCVNALLSAASFPLGVRIAQRWLAASRSWAWACAFAVALLPAAVYYSSFILTESLFIPLFLGWLVLVQAWLSAPGPSSRTVVAAAAGLVAGYAAVSHVRGLVIGALHAALCLGIAAFAARIGQRHLRRGAVVSVVCLVAVGAVGAVVDRRLEAALYPDGTWHAPVLGRLSSPAGWVRIVADGAGQLWYLSVATWVLVALGIAFAVRLLRRRGMPASVRAALALGLFVTVLIALATAAGIPGDENRVNNHVQGRYVLFTASLWALVALAALGRA